MSFISISDALLLMGRSATLTEWAHFVKTDRKANLSYWWIYCRHCVIAAILKMDPERRDANITNLECIRRYIETLPTPGTPAVPGSSTDVPVPLIGRRSVMRAHLAQCIHASPILPNPIMKPRAGRRGVHCSMAEWAHFDRLENQGYAYTVSLRLHLYAVYSRESHMLMYAASCVVDI